jgi:ribonuclease P protein component
MDLTDPSVQAFPKTLRLLERREFLRIGRKGRRIPNGETVVLVEKNSLAYTRIGITVGRTAGKSVKRNRAKRLIREYFRTHRYRFNSGYDMAVIVRDAAALEKLSDVERNFEHLLRKAVFLDASRAGRANHAGTDKSV